MSCVCALIGTVCWSCVVCELCTLLPVECVVMELFVVCGLYFCAVLTVFALYVVCVVHCVCCVVGVLLGVLYTMYFVLCSVYVVMFAMCMAWKYYCCYVTMAVTRRTKTLIRERRSCGALEMGLMECLDDVTRFLLQP